MVPSRREWRLHGQCQLYANPRVRDKTEVKQSLAMAVMAAEIPPFRISPEPNYGIGSYRIFPSPHDLDTAHLRAHVVSHVKVTVFATVKRVGKEFNFTLVLQFLQNSSTALAVIVFSPVLLTLTPHISELTWLYM
ncbi:hypothetical protein J6590_016881 [Homalodisca vitripennis]|nr:hypothetical protein J6590_016881 [Homalodisca vitripennis]